MKTVNPIAQRGEAVDRAALCVAFAAQYEEHRAVIEYNDHALNSWLHAWKPKRHKAEVDWFEPQRPHKRDQQKFLNFVANKLIDTDPTPQKTYVPYLFVMFRHGLEYKELGKAQALLERYDALVVAGNTPRIDPYTSLPRVSLKRSKRGTKSNAPNPLKAYVRDLSSFGRFLDLAQTRAKFADDKDAITARDKQYTNGGGATLHHANTDFRVYTFADAKAEAAYTGRSSRRVEQLHPDEALVEMASGARYWISPFSGAAVAADDDYYTGHVILPALLRDYPTLATVLGTVAIQQIDAALDKGLRRHDAALWEIAVRYSGRDQGRSLLPQGKIAALFQQRWPRQAATPEQEEEGGDWVDNYSRAEREKQRLEPFFDLEPDLRTLARHRQETGLVSGAFIAAVVGQVAQEAFFAESVQQMLPVIKGVQEWREAIAPQHIAPVFKALAANGQRKDKCHKKLSQLFAIVAETKRWRDGSEAEHLPTAIANTLYRKDWSTLKQILLGASDPRDPVSAMWRAAIPPAVRAEISSMQFDNAFKAHYIGKLMVRLDALDAGDTNIIRLKDMPISKKGSEEYAASARRLRHHRRAKAQARRVGIG